jgi:serine/threonine protein kinase
MRFGFEVRALYHCHSKYDVSVSIFTLESAVASSLLISSDGLMMIKEHKPSTRRLSSTSSKAPFSASSILYEDLTEICTIGTGTFGRVKLVQHKISNSVYALKAMRKDDIVSFRQHKNVISEKNLLVECKECSFIINLVATYNHPNRLCMLMEYVPGGELLTHLYDRDDTVPKSSTGGFNLDIVKFYGANVIEAFRFMGSKGIIYRDLKPENLLIDHDGYIKVVDFGFAKSLPYVENGQVVDKTYTICGTPDYVAPGERSRVLCSN